MPTLSLKTQPSIQTRITWAVSFALAWIVFAGLTCSAFAQTELADAANAAGEFELGFNRHLKLGKWFPVFIEGDQSQIKKFRITALDGDSNPIQYSGTFLQPGPSQSNQPNKLEALAKVGRAHGTITVQALDANDAIVHERTLSMANLQRMPSTSQLTLLIGANPKTESVFESSFESLFGERNNTEELKTKALVTIDDATRLPCDWRGYDTVNTVVILAQSPIFEEISEQQLAALLQWVENGGRILISGNGSSSEFSSDGFAADSEIDNKLSRFFSASFEETYSLKKMTRLDNFAKFDGGLEIARFTGIYGTTIELIQGGNPLIFRQSQGFGQAVVVAMDLNSSAFAQWKGLSPLIKQLLAPKLVDEDATTKKRSGSRVTHQGYTDLSGQLKLPLDKFSKVQVINFTVVAVLIGLYLLCIGPGDFFLLKKVLGKMELTWVTFTLMTLAFCGMAYWLGNWARPQTAQINQLEVIDIHWKSNQVRGTAWSNIYSPVTVQTDVAFSTENEIGLEQVSNYTGWFGVPGDGLGGMLTKSVQPTAGTNYQMVTDEQSKTAQLNDLTLRVSSTKSFQTEWTGKFQKNLNSRLRLRNGRLQGTVTNPFPFELKRVRVLHDTYAYILDSSVGPEQTFDVGAEAQERTIKSYMTGRKRTEENDRGQNQPWDPTGAELDRIVDMMMFYEVAGGQDYTGLSHGFQNQIEMSKQLESGQAIVVAEIDESVGRVLLNNKPATENYDQELTVFRFVLPVIKGKK